MLVLYPGGHDKHGGIKMLAMIMEVLPDVVLMACCSMKGCGTEVGRQYPLLYCALCPSRRGYGFEC